MISLDKEAALLVWEKFWQEAKQEFFKVEALQDYGAEEILQSPSYKEWWAGNKEKSLEMIRQHTKEWTDKTSLKLVKKIRIHIVEEPYTSYLEWEIMHYKLANIPNGNEEVSLVNKKDIAGVKIPGDFMMFDNERVANSHYSPEGKMLGMDIYERGEDITEFSKIKEILLQHAQKIEV